MEDGASFLSEAALRAAPEVRSVLRLGANACLVRYVDGTTSIASRDAAGRLYVDRRDPRGRVVRHGPIERERVGGGAGSASSRAEPGIVRSPTSGTVRRVAVAPGDVVAQGSPLVFVEVMKMELEVRAPAAGTIRRLEVEVGRAVDRGAILVRFDPA